ncbi:type II toxin-antitoxin system RelE family toxin [Limnochorda pilosa]|uniref:Plasmid stabilization system n=1 Tax=Limnochorda pilosa TaxID=1555112 RepID=A0A0K2SNQ2_LIMPI|nr:type II toxin-antitoxin system RelE/ParE family toxin [Limnochorda pilosa]BAS28726.1 plasmid stabilization system [Limnochorda pilosa]
MALRFELARAAEKALDRMDRQTEERIRLRLRELADDPSDPRLSKRLEGTEGLRSSRVGDWRVLFTVREPGAVLYGVGVRPRGRAYRRSN